MADLQALVDARVRAGAAGPIDHENAAYGLAEAEYWEQEIKERAR